MRIQLLSDLHLESHPHFQPTPAPQADVLVLAGDIGSYQSGSLLQDADFGLARFSPRYGWPTPVLFVPGNHEYDALDFDATHARLRDVCARLDITWLERETVLLARPSGDAAGPGAVRFVGTTLWADYDALAHRGAARDNLTEQLRLRGKAQRAANYYLKKAATTRAGAPWLAEQMREQALVCQTWLQTVLHADGKGAASDDLSGFAQGAAIDAGGATAGLAVAGPLANTVVVTHFAPSLRSADPRYGLNPATAGFCNSLDPLLEHADLWLHGHLHCPSDYLHAKHLGGNCRVVANPMGYARKNEQLAFKPDFCVVV